MELKAGSRVKHPLFGVGIVRAVSGSGPAAKLTVEFGGNVGTKKLLAQVAKLTVLDDDAPAGSVAAAVWYETLEVGASPRAGRHALVEKTKALLQHTVRQHEFWMAVRERLRRSGSAPRVLDDIGGNLQFAVSGAIEIKVTIRHRELLAPAQQILARATLDELAARQLADFTISAPRVDFGTEADFDEQHAVRLDEQETGPLPDRAPKQRSRPVPPKGVILPFKRRERD